MSYDLYIKPLIYKGFFDIPVCILNTNSFRKEQIECRFIQITPLKARILKNTHSHTYNFVSEILLYKMIRWNLFTHPTFLKTVLSSMLSFSTVQICFILSIITLSGIAHEQIIRYEDVNPVSF